MDDRDPLVAEMERARRGRHRLVVVAAIGLCIALVAAMAVVVGIVTR